MPRDALPLHKLTDAGVHRRRSLATQDLYGLSWTELCTLVAIVARARHGLTTRRKQIAEFLAEEEGVDVHGLDSLARLRMIREVRRAFHGPKLPGLEVLHGDGNQLNNAARNLRWGTQADNAADREAHGRTARGQRNGAYTKPERRRRGTENGNSKLEPETVLAIFHDARPQSRIAADHGVNQTLVSAIKLGRIWNHVTGLPPYPAREQARAHFGGG
jgi:HNH endonuclease